MKRKILTPFIFVLLFLTVGAIFGPPSRLRSGTGAPSSLECNNAGDVSKVYIRRDAAATNGSLSICSNTAADTYAWETPGGGTGADSTASYLQLALSGTNTADRVFVPSTGWSCVDGGVNGNYTCSVDTTVVPSFIANSVALDFPPIVDGGCQALTMTLTGAATGNAVSLGLPSTHPTKVSATGRVSSANTITIDLCNNSGAESDPVSGTYTAHINRSFQ